MATRYRLSTIQKTRKLVRMFGGVKITVRVMGATSASSLKRWMNGECKPIRAHAFLLDDTYKRAEKLRQGIKGILRNFKSGARKEFYAFFGNLKNRLK